MGNNKKINSIDELLSCRERSGKTIMIVDNDENYLRYVAGSLRNAGYRALAITSGIAALSLLDKGAVVDLLVTDHIMPGMNGLDFMAAVRKRNQALPIVFLTGRCDGESYSAAQKLGAYAVVSKPVRMSELRAMVNAALGGPTPCDCALSSGPRDATAEA